MHRDVVTRTPRVLVGRALYHTKTFITSLNAEPRPTAWRHTPQACTRYRLGERFAQCNSMLNADHRFSGFAMRTKKD